MLDALLKKDLVVVHTESLEDDLARAARWLGLSNAANQELSHAREGEKHDKHVYEKLSAGHEANLRAELGREYEILDQLSRADHWRGGTQWWWESRHLLRPSPSPAP